MIEARFYETYYFCNVVRNVLHDQFSYLRNLNDFYCDDRIFYLVQPFQKYSVFQEFIEFIVEDIFHEEVSKVELVDRRGVIEKFKDIPSAINDIKPKVLPIEHAFNFHEIEYLGFESYLEGVGKSFDDASEDDVYDYMNEIRLSGDYETLVQQTVKEVFHVLFQNRRLLMVFNQMMAAALEHQADLDPPEEQASFFSRSGFLKRTVIPKWVKRAVYFRDRGRCVLCDKDLSGMLNIDNQENYDHIVPLAKHGLNDVSNIQLLCKECNQNEKRAGNAITSNRYQSWYVYD
jgi:hypothetical protein